MSFISKICAFSMLFVGVLLLSGGDSRAEEKLVTIPDDMASFMGDPDRGSEPEAKYQKPGKWNPTVRPVVVSEGHPVRDYGHYRMKKSVVLPASPLIHIPSEDEYKKAFSRFKVHTWEDGKDLLYSFMTPDESIEAPKNGFPLVICFPGIGGIGKTSLSQGRKSSQVLQWGTDAYRKAFPAYVLHPHPKYKTHKYRDTGGADATEMIDHYLDLIDHIVKENNIDKNRIYICGFSMGGTSCWQLMLKRPDFFAAAAPCAGVPLVDPEEAAVVKDVPIWMFCGNQDPWSGSIMYIKTYQNLVDAKAAKVRFWEIQDMAHSGKPLNLTAIADWLFKQSRE